MFQAIADLPEYPGRGLAVGRLESSDTFWLYFVTGRSEASMSRRAVEVGKDIRVESTDGSSDDPLRHYTAFTSTERLFFVGNGAHVIDLSTQVTRPEEFLAAFQNWQFEPDPPINTARIAAIAPVDDSESQFVLGAARLGDGAVCEHLVMAVPVMPAGRALALRTYGGEAKHVRPDATPHWVTAEGSLNQIAANVWNSLSADLRVLLVAGDSSRRVVMHHR